MTKEILIAMCVAVGGITYVALAALAKVVGL